MNLPDLTDGVVRLRPMTLADGPTHLAGEDDVTVQFLSGGRSTIDTVTNWIRRSAKSLETGGPVQLFGIREVSSDRLVGMVEANPSLTGLREGVTNVSYGLYPDARGKGYATRAVNLMCEYLAAETTADTAVIQVHLDNEASARVPPRAGFSYEGGVSHRMTGRVC